MLSHLCLRQDFLTEASGELISLIYFLIKKKEDASFRLQSVSVTMAVLENYYAHSIVNRSKIMQNHVGCWALLHYRYLIWGKINEVN